MGAKMNANWRTEWLNASRRATRGVSLTAAALALALLGCAASTGPQKYPSDWSSIKTVPRQRDCPNLAGTYSNSAAAAFPQNGDTPPSLSQLVSAIGNMSSHKVHGSWGPIGDFDSVSFAQTAESLTATFAKSATAGVKLTFAHLGFYTPEESQGDRFTCFLSSGVPRLFFMSTVDDRLPIPPNTVGTQLILLRAIDGSLIVQLRSNSYEVIDLGLVGGPVVHHSSVWYRYPPTAAGASATAHED
jgi:hypothetical protein